MSIQFRMVVLSILCTFSMILAVAVFAEAASSSAMIKITGKVKNELDWSIEDLKAFQSINTQRNDITSDRTFNGNFYFRGVPLRTLLESAGIDKTGASFNKPIDMAIRIKNSSTSTALSWGEIFYRDSGTVIIAYAGTPILPHHGCTDCHTPDQIEPIMARYHRTVEFPRLVITTDQYSDRCLEGITEIEVIQTHMKINPEEPEHLYSSKFSVIRADQTKQEFEDLSGVADFYTAPSSYTVGEGKGFHGFQTFSGYKLVDVLAQANIDRDLDSVFMVSAPDNYRAVFSYGEIYLKPDGQRIMLATEENGNPLEKGGKYYLIVPEDLMADRWIKAVDTIRKISLE